MTVAGASIYVLDIFKSIYQKHRDTIANPIVKQLSDECWQKFLEVGLPETNWEDWQYTDLNAMYENLSNSPTLILKKNLDSPQFISSISDQILLENGKLKHASVNNNLKVMSIAQLNQIELNMICQKIEMLILKEKNPFALFSFSFFASGILVKVPDKINHKILITSECKLSSFISPFICISMGENASAEIIYQEKREQKGVAGVNSMLLIDGNENSKLNLNHLQIDGSNGYHFSQIRLDLKRSARVSMQGIYFGSELSRHDVIAELNSEGAEFNCRVINILKNINQQHHFIRVKHNAPHGTSDQLFKNILFDKGKVSVDGTVEVARGAKLTNSQQLINNLFLSDSARAFTKPNLRILNEDVKCKHGATSGALEKEHLFYLKSRGLSDDAARHLILKSFTDEVLIAFKNPELIDFVSKVIFENTVIEG